MATSLQILKKIEQKGLIESMPESFYKKIIENKIDTFKKFKDTYRGKHKSGALFSETICEDVGYLEESNLPPFIMNHIDLESVWAKEFSWSKDVIATMLRKLAEKVESDENV